MADQFVVADGRTIVLRNLDKILYPETGTTKSDVLMYYSTVADVMLPLVRDRAATRRRWPHGVSGDSFYEKTTPKGAPSWLTLLSIPHTRQVKKYPLINDLSTLLWLAQLSCLEIHVPQWRVVGTDLDAAFVDRFVVDLDPGEGAGLNECSEVALVIRSLLKKEAIEAHPVTSGSKGMQIYAGISGRTSDECSDLVRALGVAAQSHLPGLVVTNMAKAARKDRVFVDWSQNSAAKTTIAPYSLRGLNRPFVAAPRTWAEVESGDLRQLEMDEVVDRLSTNPHLMQLR